MAERLGITRILVPRHPGVLSGWGAISADVVKEYARTLLRSGRTIRDSELHRVCSSLERDGRKAMKQEGYGGSDVQVVRSLDMRYAGQSYELNVPFTGDWSVTCSRFHDLHEKRYRHRADDREVEAVTARVRLIGKVTPPVLRRIGKGGRDIGHAVEASNDGILHVNRDALRGGNECAGPALVHESFSTTWIHRGWKARTDPWGHLRLEVTS